MRDDEYYRMYEVAPQLWWYQSLRGFLKNVLRLYAPSSAKVLDAGCGTGENMQLLQQLGYTVHGVDISTTAITLAKKRGLKRVQSGSILELPFRDKSFDAAYSTDVLIMFGQKQVSQAVGELHRVLKNDGVVFVQCAALESLRSSHDIVVKARHRYTVEELQKFLPSDQWQILISSYRFFWIFPIIAGVKWLKKNESTHEAESDVQALPVWLNTLFFWIQSIEDFLIIRCRVRLPFGSSVAIVARKKITSS